MRPYSEGSPTASVVIVGESLGDQEIRKGKPFSGYSGIELTNMLGEVGLDRNRMYLTNVLHSTAPPNLFYKKTEAAKRGIRELAGRYPHPKVEEAYWKVREELKALQPNVIIAMGDTALWALTGYTEGITKWRGSIIDSEFGKVVCTFNPVVVIRNWAARYIIVQDLKRAAAESLTPDLRKPDWKFLTRPTFHEAIEALEGVRGKLSSWDIETLNGQVECIGFSADGLNAACIPFMERASGRGHSYWSYDEEYELTLLLRDVLEETPTIWQNMAYDLQWLARQWGFIPRNVQDTMIMQHTCFPGLEKSLNFIASVMCDYYTYWKEDRKTSDDDERWIYNCTDCCYTFEIFQKLRASLQAYDLEEQYEFQRELFWPVFNMMLRGTKVDLAKKRKLSGELLVARKDRIEWIEYILGHSFNPNSPLQMKTLFFQDFGIKPIRHRKTKQLTTDDDALEKIRTKQPLLNPIIDAIQEIRSIGVFKSTFADALLDGDGRVRASFNLTGAETFRFSSSKNVFGTGMNLQNIPKGTEKD